MDGRFRLDTCDNPDRGLLVFRRVLNKELNEQHLEQLFSSGAPQLIKGFKGKKGNSFDAFDDEFNVTLAFPEKKRGKKR